MTATVVTVRNPFDPGRREVRQIARRRRIRALAPRTAQPHIALLNGAPVLRRAWNRKLRDGDVLAFVVLPEGGDSNPLSIIAMLAIMVFAPPLANLIAGEAYFGFGLTAYQVALPLVQFAGMALVNALIPPPKLPSTHAQASPSPTYSLQAQGNSARLDASIPAGYGTLKIFPDFASQPYIRYLANDQYLYMLYCVGLGDYSVSDLKIGDTPLEQAQYQVVHPGDPISLFPSSVITSDDVTAIDLETQDAWTLGYPACPEGSVVNRIQVDIVLPNGLFYATDEGIMDSREVRFQFQVREVGSSTWLDCYREEHQITSVESVWSWWFLYVTDSDQAWSSGETDPTAHVDGAEDTLTIGGTLYTGNWDWKQANFEQTVTSTDAWMRIVQGTNNACRRSYILASLNTGSEIKRLPWARYEVRAARLLNSKSTEVREQNTILWTGLHGYLPETKVYPDATMLAVKVKATSNLTAQSSRQINCLATRRLAAWQQFLTESPAIPGDPYWDSVLLYAPLTDYFDRTSHYTLARTGNVGITVDDAFPINDGQVMTFDGTYPSFLTLDSEIVIPNTTYWTAECWAWVDPLHMATEFTMTSGNGYICYVGARNAGKGAAFGSSDHSDFDYGTTYPVIKGQWVHLAVVNGPADSNGYKVHFYVNGVQATPGSIVFKNAYGLHVKYIGYEGKGGYVWWGKLAEMRVTPEARYLGNFNPPSRAFPQTTVDTPAGRASGWNPEMDSRSIAWALADVCRQPWGGNLPDARIDLEGLARLDATWTARGDTFDGRFDNTIVFWEALTRIAAAGRARPYIQGGIVRFARDEQASLPVAMFTPRNIVKNSLSIAYLMPGDEMANSIELTYWDATVWQPRAVTCELAGLTSATRRSAKVELFGVTGREQAYREGLYQVASNLYRRKLIKFQTEMEGFIPSLGDLITISHDMPAWGQSGEVTDWDASTLTLTLSQPVTWASAKPHYIGLRTRSGGVDGPYLVRAGNSRQQIILAEMPATDILLSGRSERTWYTFGWADTWRQPAKVIAVRPAGIDRVDIEAINEDDAVHTADTGVSAPPAQYSQLPSLFIKPVLRGLSFYGLPGRSNSVTLSWYPAPGADHYLIEQATSDSALDGDSDPDGGFTRVGQTSACNFTTATLYSPVSLFRVCAVGAVRGDWVLINVDNSLDAMYSADGDLMWSATSTDLMFL